jgi:flavorubredoxin
MRALVVYESMYGNTHLAAGNIADGLRGNPSPGAVRTWPAGPSALVPG